MCQCVYGNSSGLPRVHQFETHSLDSLEIKMKVFNISLASVSRGIRGKWKHSYQTLECSNFLLNKKERTSISSSSLIGKILNLSRIEGKGLSEVYLTQTIQWPHRVKPKRARSICWIGFCPRQDIFRTASGLLDISSFTLGTRQSHNHNKEGIAWKEQVVFVVLWRKPAARQQAAKITAAFQPTALFLWYQTREGHFHPLVTVVAKFKKNNTELLFGCSSRRNISVFLIQLWPV